MPPFFHAITVVNYFALKQKAKAMVKTLRNDENAVRQRKKNYDFNMWIEKELLKRKQYKKDVRYLRKEEKQ